MNKFRKRGKVKDKSYGRAAGKAIDSLTLGKVTGERLHTSCNHINSGVKSTTFFRGAKTSTVTSHANASYSSVICIAEDEEDRRFSTRKGARKSLSNGEIPPDKPSKSTAVNIVPSDEAGSGVTCEAAVNMQDSSIGQTPPPVLPPPPSLLRCPHCSKTFLSLYGLIAHLDAHPKYAIKCHQCSVTFPTNRGLIMHRRMKHSMPSATSSTAGGDTALTADGAEAGFCDLAFADFSCKSFPTISHHWCEQRPRPTMSPFHDFTCSACHAAFPLSSALQLHTTKTHQEKGEFACEACGREFSSLDGLHFHKLPVDEAQSRFAQHLQLFPACVRSKRPAVHVDDSHINTSYYSLLMEYKERKEERATTSSPAAGDNNSPSAEALGNGVVTKNGLLRRSRQS